MDWNHGMYCSVRYLDLCYTLDKDQMHTIWILQWFNFMKEKIQRVGWKESVPVCYFIERKWSPVSLLCSSSTPSHWLLPCSLFYLQNCRSGEKGEARPLWEDFLCMCIFHPPLQGPESGQHGAFRGDLVLPCLCTACMEYTALLWTKCSGYTANWWNLKARCTACLSIYCMCMCGCTCTHRTTV
jgi:hypothetical protein